MAETINDAQTIAKIMFDQTVYNLATGAVLTGCLLLVLVARRPRK